MRTCETCGAELVRHPKHSRKQWESKRFCERQCAAQRLVKPHYCGCGCGERPLPQRKYIKGHRPLRLTANGYRRVCRPKHPLADKHGMVLEHRAVLYDAGVMIAPSEHVHHRNGIKDDNRLENLEVLASSDHTRRHVHERGTVSNQFGTFPVLTDPVARKQRERAHNQKQKTRRAALA